MKIGIIGAGFVDRTAAKLAVAAESLAEGVRFQPVTSVYCKLFTWEGLAQALAAQ